MPMQQFINIDLRQPEQDKSVLVENNFNEVKKSFQDDEAKQQASRCEQCGIPFCSYGCPLQNHIPDWLKKTVEGKITEAWQIAQLTNNFPEICGRICPQERLCEGNCVLERSGNGTVAIGAIERFVADYAKTNNLFQPIVAKQERQQSVGIVGAGPAALAAAMQLRSLGYQVHIYDRNAKAGGLLSYGIPNFKLDKSHIDARIEQLKSSNINFVQNCNVGSDITLGELQEKHDALLLAIGTYKGHDLGLATKDYANMSQAIDYLILANKLGYNEDAFDITDGNLNPKGKDIVVIGAGDTAMDCCNTSWRLGAKSVTCMRRRPLSEVAGAKSDMQQALSWGTNMLGMTTASAIIDDGQKIKEVEIVELERQKEDDGSYSYCIKEGSKKRLKADIVIQALGFAPQNVNEMFSDTELAINKNGTIIVDDNNMTSANGIFAAGDIIRGSSLVVWAIYDGRKAASSIHNYLKNI